MVLEDVMAGEQERAVGGGGGSELLEARYSVRNAASSRLSDSICASYISFICRFTVRFTAHSSSSMAMYCACCSSTVSRRPVFASTMTAQLACVLERRQSRSRKQTITEPVEITE